jgi:hypothetical protein
MKILVMGGKGAVGSVIANAYAHCCPVDILDVDSKPDGSAYDFLHVAIPNQPDFVHKVRDAAKEYKAKRIVVHSTVPVGTTRQLGETACHSPILGQHDDLGISLYRFPKFYASVDPKQSALFAEQIALPGIEVRPMVTPEATEFGKLFTLSRFLNDLAMYEEGARMAAQFKIPKETIVSWTKAYNEGYACSRFTVPDLKFPDGVIGGKCVYQGAKALHAQTQNELLASHLARFKHAG